MKSIREEYRRFLNTEKGARLYNSFKLILYGDEDSLIQTLNSSVLQCLSSVQKDVVEICDIGGGDGNRITHILKFLHGKFKIHFRLDFIEQSKQFVDAFDTAPIISFGEVTRLHGLFESVALPRQYDLVFLIHSIFAFENGRAINKVLSLPTNDGKIIVVSNAPNSFLGGLKLHVDEGYGDVRYEIDLLEADLIRRNVRFTRNEFQTKWAIEDHEYDKQVHTLLDWISLGTYDSLTQDRKKRIQDYISARTTRVDRRTFFTEDEVILVIPTI